MRDVLHTYRDRSPQGEVARQRSWRVGEGPSRVAEQLERARRARLDRLPKTAAAHSSLREEKEARNDDPRVEQAWIEAE